MKAISYIFVFWLMCAVNVASAQTFLGKRFSADVGLGFNPNVLTPFLNNENYFSKWSVLPPSLNFGVGFAPISKLNVRFELGLNQPQISGATFRSEYLFESINQQYIDTFYFSSKSTDFGVNLRLYQEYAPVGRYFSVFAGYSSVKTTIIPSTSYWNITPNTYYFQSDRHAATEVESNAIKLGMGFGRTQLLLRYVHLDFGVRTSFVFMQNFITEEEYAGLLEDVNSPSYKQGYSIDYSETGQKTLTKSMRKSLQNSYFIEVYLNFGLNF